MIIDTRFLDQITKLASENTRLRMNYNFHESLDSNAQRLLNALEPGTEVPIHRHPHTSETYILVRGNINVFFYDEEKNIIESFHLNPQTGNYGVHIPKGVWHSLQVVESTSVIFEVKDGPYCPLEEHDIKR